MFANRKQGIQYEYTQHHAVVAPPTAVCSLAAPAPAAALLLHLLLLRSLAPALAAAAAAAAAALAAAAAAAPAVPAALLLCCSCFLLPSFRRLIWEYVCIKAFRVQHLVYIGNHGEAGVLSYLRKPLRVHAARSRWSGRISCRRQTSKTRLLGRREDAGPLWSRMLLPLPFFFCAVDVVHCRSFHHMFGITEDTPHMSPKDRCVVAR